uniref:hypothetical protein n=1 Tax=uncultured Methanobrevibacter sp. TaxID=253161 RepID=UPI002602AB3B
SKYNERVKVLIVFNHPAPYKVKIFNELSKLIDLDVLFERTAASDRPKDFYDENNIQFNATFLKDCYFGAENTFTSKVKNYIKKHHKEYDLIIKAPGVVLKNVDISSFKNKLITFYNKINILKLIN